ncbi:E3 ubiquitin-protein ligase TRIM8-like isoform X3 [Dicentrarchus labrax]|uniref:E3 ubiquitin-protein ligase TRIM8-like isoform X3 n=1 Tax=Dicentrarchus labrax TaxID=13489 RepID=UPI0021F556D3|nr:E3 ubiquitin-protein ligase TRIM8-like isoform X3 [Dicentrarchus labrax]
MATASPFLSEDQFLCSICLDVFTEPVSIPCGHNFCKACITRHWEGKEQCQCPLCNEKFNKGLKLRVNTGFREVVENFKKHHVIADNNQPIKPGQVPCDCCLGKKFKASKTCLVCLTSYCETHLEPHQRVAALKRHKLTNPVHNLEDKICKKHNRILELFCRNDLTRVCVLCTEHSTHDTVPLEEPYVDKRAQMKKKKAEVQEIKSKRGKKGKKPKVSVQTEREGVDEEVEYSVEFPHLWCFHTEGLHPFHRYFFLPGYLGFSEGRFYYKVEVKGRTGWDLGVVRESVLRKRTFKPNTRNGSWIIRLENNTNCKALHNVPDNVFLSRKPERVMVFVDYDSGLVSICDADTATMIYTFTGCKFQERIFLYYRPTEEVSSEQKLHILLLLFLIFLIWICSN